MGFLEHIPPWGWLILVCVLLAALALLELLQPPSPPRFLP